MRTFFQVAQSMGDQITIFSNAPESEVKIGSIRTFCQDTIELCNLSWRANQDALRMHNQWYPIPHNLSKERLKDLESKRQELWALNDLYQTILRALANIQKMLRVPNAGSVIELNFERMKGSLVDLKGKVLAERTTIEDIGNLLQATQALQAFFEP